LSRIPTLKHLLTTEPTDAFLLFALAKEYETAGDTATALHFYLQCAEHNPSYVGLYYHLGKHYEKAGNTEQAIATYKEGMNVATAANDRHAFGELKQANWELTDDDDDF
jgi:tetratricopeptide (TPR) repeat protein